LQVVLVEPGRLDPPLGEDGADGPPQGVDGLLGGVLGVGRPVEDLAVPLGPAVGLEAVDEELAPGMDPEIRLAGRGAEQDLGLVEPFEDAMDRPGLGDPLAEGAGELAVGGRPDAAAGDGGGVEVDAIDAAAAELIGLLRDGLGVVVGGLGVPLSSEQERTLSPADSAAQHTSGRNRRVIRASCEVRLQGGHHRQ
jgi:hypothetical protein